ncbi:MAG: hypothetical protein AAFU85_14215 [Planctomycetota bacterium]
MKPLTSIVIVGIAIGATVFGAGFEGRLSHRWQNDARLVRLGAAATDLPDEFGGWKRIQTSEISGNAQRLLSCFSSSIHRFRNIETGREIEAAVLFGPSGPISVHTPDVCYSSREYRNLGQRVRVSEGADRYWVIDFQSRDLEGNYLRSIYAWSTAEHWEAPDSSRFQYAGEPHLVKVQFAVTGPTLESLREPVVMQFVEAYCKRISHQMQNAKQ